MKIEERELFQDRLRELVRDVEKLDSETSKTNTDYSTLIEFAEKHFNPVEDEKVAPKVFVPFWYYEWVTEQQEEGYEAGDTVASLWSNLYRGPFAYYQERKDWVLENKALASRAILDGCLEELFLVVLPGTEDGEAFLSLEEGKISYTDRLDYYHNRSEVKQIFTENEIVAIDKRFMLFTKPLELDEEGNPL